MSHLPDGVEVGFVLLLVAGVAIIHVPAAMILAGVLGIIGCERASVRGARRSTAPERRLERVA